MQPLSTLRSATVVLPFPDIDTDQIIPARFLTTTSRAGLGEHLFADWRRDPDFALNQPGARDCAILVAGHNFGCGSSREHAPWALLDYGIRAVISTRIADIFQSNALKNGLLPIVVDTATHQWLLRHPGADVTVDLQASHLRLPDAPPVEFSIDSFARHCLLHGIDPLGYLRGHHDAIDNYEKSHP